MPPYSVTSDQGLGRRAAGRPSRWPRMSRSVYAVGAGGERAAADDAAGDQELAPGHGVHRRASSAGRVYSGLARPSASSLRGVAGGVGRARRGSGRSRRRRPAAGPARRAGRLRRRGRGCPRPAGLACAASAAASRSRACGDEVVSQAAPAGQPPTLGGRSGTWPSPSQPAEQLLALLVRQRRRVDAELPQRADQPLDRLLDQLAARSPANAGSVSSARSIAVTSRPRPYAATSAACVSAGIGSPEANRNHSRRARNVARAPAAPPAGRRTRRRRSRPVWPRIVLAPVVVPVGLKRRGAGRPVDGPAGQRPGAGLDVVLGVVRRCRA